LKDGLGKGSDFSMLMNDSSACWRVPKNSWENVFHSLYVLLIRFAYTVGLALLGSVGVFLLVAGDSVESLFGSSGVS
jgi:hypothetical protein